jgi:hypothetical protein
MAIFPMKEAKVIVVMDDLDFQIRNVAFEAKVFNKYGTFDRIVNRNMENPSYAYLHCDLLDRAALTTINMKVKSPHIEMHAQHLQKGLFMNVENFGMSQSPKGVLKKGICMLSLQLSQQPLCHQCVHSNPI